MMAGQSTANVFYNNIFNGTNGSVYVNVTLPNSFNTTPFYAINIFGGPNIGGNYYANRANNGFSDTCGDNNFDGLCDSQYNIPNATTDFFPISTNKISTLTACQDITVGTRYYFLQNAV